MSIVIFVNFEFYLAFTHSDFSNGSAVCLFLVIKVYTRCMRIGLAGIEPAFEFPSVFHLNHKPNNHT